MVQGCAQSKALSVHWLAISVAHNQDYVNLGPRGELRDWSGPPPSRRVTGPVEQRPITVQQVPMTLKLWFAEVVEVVCEMLCILFGHAHGCFLLNSRWSPLQRPHWWALNVRWDETGPHPSWAEPPAAALTVSV